LFPEHHLRTKEDKDASIMRSFLLYLPFPPENINPVIKVLVISHSFNFSRHDDLEDTINMILKERDCKM
jgi:hypothetical protein